jgi:hypothetical protein
MARKEVDREDLLREATALVERAELRAEGFNEPAVIGFRGNGCGSVYIGTEPAWHFNSKLQLRRAFVDGRIVKAENGRLVALERRRAGGEVQLVRHELSNEPSRAMRARARAALDQLQQALEDMETHEMIGQSPEDVDVLQGIRDWLATLPRNLLVASSPHSR